MKSFIKFIVIILLLSSCAVSNNNLESDSAVLGIRPTVSNRAVPRESAFQVELELNGVVNDAALQNSDIYYDWSVEELKIDIKESFSDKLSDLSSDIAPISTPNYLVETAKNRLNCYLSLYKPGFYKITLNSKSGVFNSSSSVILKVGEPELPQLYTKVNIPPQKSLKASGYRGGFFLDIRGERLAEIVNLKASSLKDGWYNTGITMDPFSSFTLLAGTHIGSYQDNEKNTVSTLYSLGRESGGSAAGNLKYSFSGSEEGEEFTLSPLLFTDKTKRQSVTIYKDSKTNWQGTVYLTLLTWGLDGEGRERFGSKELSISDSSPRRVLNLNSYFLTKLFAGSYGHKVAPGNTNSSNNYFVYFSPEGVNSKDFDLDNKRDIPGLPYGYLLGRLGKNGKVFPIGSMFSYYYSDRTPLYYLDKNSKFRLKRL